MIGICKQINWDFQRNQEKAALDDVSVTDKSEAEVVYILLDRYEGNITLLTDIRHWQPCSQNVLAHKTPVASSPPARRGRALRQTTPLECLQCTQGLHNSQSTNGTRENRIYGEIVQCPRFRTNRGKFRFLYICMNWFVSIINSRKRKSDKNIRGC